MMQARTNVPSRALTFGGGGIVIAGLAIGLTLYANDFTPSLWMLTALGTIAIAFVGLNALPIRGSRMRRTGLAAEAVFLDIPIVAPFFCIDGATGAMAAALMLAAGYAVAAIASRSRAPTDILRHGVLRALVALALVPFVTQFTPLVTGTSIQGSALFALSLLGAMLAFGLLISAPASALTYHVPMLRLWQRVVSDPRTWVAGASNLIWATAVRDALLRDQYAFTLIMWTPVVAIALLLRTIDDQHAELHRLRLVSDAVQAMLGDRDPLPQITAILATLRVPAHDETVTVLAATSARVEAWRTVTLLGPILSPAGDELRRRLLARLKFSSTPSITLNDPYYIAYAFATQLKDGELHGALIVHRRHDSPLNGEQMAKFSNAAHELAPLLRDMRSIAATQSAATIDGLTGLFNRAATIDHLDTMLENPALIERGAVLLLDIDHFKTINDQLGHGAGDDCLRQIGGIIKHAVRGGDTAGRIGGEEFLVVMPGATRDVAMTVGERLRLAIALGGMRYQNGEPVTASIGVAAASVGESSQALLARADRALYSAKNQGRNCIVEDFEESA